VTHVPVSDAALQHLRTVVDLPAVPSDKYELQEILGRGGMGTVYLARDKELDRLVAIKVLASHITSPGSVERLVREAKILARLEHPGIVPVHDVGVTPDGRPYYVMKLVKGNDLSAHARDDLSLGAMLRVFERICDAVAFAHAHGVIHRDLKPGNVMVGAFGEVLVMDWGVAKFAAAVESPGTVLGTPGYMAPEQAIGDVENTDQRADVFSLGAILGFLLPEAPPPALRAIAKKAAAADPGERYQTVAALADDISRFRAAEAVIAYPESLLDQVRRVAWKYRVPLGLVLAYVIMRMLLMLIRA
jgi:serine/threonine-protein kinase